VSSDSDPCICALGTLPTTTYGVLGRFLPSQTQFKSGSWHAKTSAFAGVFAFLAVGVRRGPSPPPSLPQRAALDSCHGARQGPLPDRADAMGTRAPREVPTGLARGQWVSKGYGHRGSLGSLPLQSASNSNKWEVGPYILEPTQ